MLATAIPSQPSKTDPSTPKQCMTEPSEERKFVSESAPEAIALPRLKFEFTHAVSRSPRKVKQHSVPPLIRKKAVSSFKDHDDDNCVTQCKRLEREWAGSDELKGCFDYVTQAVPHVHDPRDPTRDVGHEGWSLEDFLRLPQAVSAKLNRAHVLALRLYTGPGYKFIQAYKRRCLAERGPKRQHDEGEGDAGNDSADFAVVCALLNEAIRQLAVLSPQQELYRGLKGAMCSTVLDSYYAFFEHQDTSASPAAALQWLTAHPTVSRRSSEAHRPVEVAFMSTTASLANTAEFGTDVLFVLHTLPGTQRVADARGGTCVANGAAVGWVSQYPLECEVLFPPRTILMPLRVAEPRPHVFHFCPLVSLPKLLV